MFTTTHLKSAAVAALLFAGVAGAAPTADEVTVQVERAARQQLAERAARTGLMDPVFDLNVVPANRPLPACRQALRVESIDVQNARRMRFAATCPGSDGWRREFIVRAGISATVLVAAVALPTGRTISAADLVLVQRDVTALPDALSDPHAVVGMASRRSIRAGEPVRESWLAQSTAVRRGAVVSIVAHSDNIEVTAPGEALDSGALDAVIRVRNTSNGKVIRARVISNTNVEPVEVARAIP